MAVTNRPGLGTRKPERYGRRCSGPLVAGWRAGRCGQHLSTPPSAERRRILSRRTLGRQHGPRGLPRPRALLARIRCARRYRWSHGARGKHRRRRSPRHHPRSPSTEHLRQSPAARHYLGAAPVTHRSRHIDRQASRVVPLQSAAIACLRAARQLERRDTAEWPGLVPLTPTARARRSRQPQCRTGPAARNDRRHPDERRRRGVGRQRLQRMSSGDGRLSPVRQNHAALFGGRTVAAHLVNRRRFLGDPSSLALRVGRYPRRLRLRLGTRLAAAACLRTRHDGIASRQKPGAIVLSTPFGRTDQTSAAR